MYDRIQAMIDRERKSKQFFSLRIGGKETVQKVKIGRPGVLAPRRSFPGPA